MDNFSERLRKARSYRNVGQVELAEKIGVSKGTIGNWETSPPKNLPAQLKEVSEVLGVSLSYLRGESENMVAVQSDAQRVYGKLKLNTLANNIADLASSLPTAPPYERKHIIGNLRDMLDEVEQRELSGGTNEREKTTETRAKMIVAGVLPEAQQVSAESGSLQKEQSNTDTSAAPKVPSPASPIQKRTPPKPAPK